MAFRLVAIFCLFLLFGCGGGTAVPEDAQAPRVDAPTPLPNIYVDDRGNRIKRDGWVPGRIALGRKLGSTGKTTWAAEDGSDVEVTVDVHSLPNPLIIETPYASDRLNAGHAPAKATSVTVAAVGRGEPFCYYFILHKAEPVVTSDNSWHDHGISTRYCDMNGDGVFETAPNSDLRVPAWAIAAR